MSLKRLQRVAAKAATAGAASLLVGAGIMSAVSTAHAQNGGDAMAILKSMSDFIVAQKTISVSYNSDIEAITPQLQKIQFDSSGTLQMMRPNMIHATRTGGYADLEMFDDGKNFVIDNKAANTYFETQAPGTVDQLVHKIRMKLGADIPGADLLLDNPYAVLSEGVMDAKHVDRGVVNGITCEHLAFRDHDTDWQIWIQTGPKPIPRKFVITSKAVTGAPQYTLVITDWKSDVALKPDIFTFKPPADAKKVDRKGLGHIDEVPLGVIQGGKK